MKKIEVINDKCISCGMCIIESENQGLNVFGWDEDGKSKVINHEVNEKSEPLVELCPTGAIIIIEEN